MNIFRRIGPVIASSILAFSHERSASERGNPDRPEPRKEPAAPQTNHIHHTTGDRLMLKPFLFIAALAISLPGLAADPAATPGAKLLDIQYSGQKAVYDTAVNTVQELSSVMARAGFLSAINGADPFENKIVIVLHGNEIPFFAIKNHDKYKDLMTRAQSLTVGGIIEFRMCIEAAAGHGLAPKDIHSFVSMVPMGDAEIIRLQHEGYGYMR
jgi:uncharacterized protein